MSRSRSRNSTLGTLHGEGIENKATILSEIDSSLNCNAPDIEFILADSYITYNKDGKQTIINKIKGYGGYGHAALRYKHYPDSNKKNKNNEHQDIVMNIVGPAVKDCAMVNFIPTEEYLFGTDKLDKECEQGGIYNRRFYGLRIQNVSKSKLKALHYHFKSLQYREKGNDSSFKFFGV